MRFMKKASVMIELVVYGILVVVLCGAVIGLFYVVNKNCTACEYCELIVRYGDRVQMYDDRNMLYAKVNGVYFHDSYYCVWTANRTRWNLTEAHEQVHAMIEQDAYCGSGGEKCYEHFCGND